MIYNYVSLLQSNHCVIKSFRYRFLNPSNRGEIKIYGQVEDTPVKGYSRDSSVSLSISSGSEINLDDLMQQGLPQSKPPEPTPQTILAQNIQQRQNGNFY